MLLLISSIVSFLAIYTIRRYPEHRPSSFHPVVAYSRTAHFDARRSIYSYCFFANIAEFCESLIYSPEKERIEQRVFPKEEKLIYKDIDIFNYVQNEKSGNWNKRKTGLSYKVPNTKIDILLMLS
ncbi:MAG: hypothetical protein ACFFDT_12455 [Candidatus Hodarchaeota archaeon]